MRRGVTVEPKRSASVQKALSNVVKVRFSSITGGRNEEVHFCGTCRGACDSIIHTGSGSAKPRVRLEQ
jgi:hypothetical protein